MYVQPPGMFLKTFILISCVSCGVFRLYIKAIYYLPTLMRFKYISLCVYRTGDFLREMGECEIVSTTSCVCVTSCVRIACAPTGQYVHSSMEARQCIFS